MSWFKTPEQLTAERDERAATQARQRRNKLLSDTDHTQLPDSRLTGPQKAAMVQYRNELRDLTDQPGFPHQIEWPEPPYGNQ